MTEVKTLGDLLGEQVRKRAHKELVFLGIPKRTIKALNDNKVGINHLMGWYFAGGRKRIFNEASRLPGIGSAGANKLASCVTYSVRLGFIVTDDRLRFLVNLPD